MFAMENPVISKTTVYPVRFSVLLQEYIQTVSLENMEWLTAVSTGVLNTILAVSIR